MKGGASYSSLVDLGGIRENLAFKIWIGPSSYLRQGMYSIACYAMCRLFRSWACAFDLSARDVPMCRGATELLEMTVFW